MKYIIAILYSFWLINSFGQDLNDKKDCMELIKLIDISHLWTTDKIQIEEDTSTIERMEPIGFIGDNYQRLYIHYISVIKNPVKANEYMIYGKTKVKNNICEFQGEIEIKEAYTYVYQDISELIQGKINGSYEFYENPNEKGSGVFIGEFTTDFFIDPNDEIKYNGLTIIADGFKNNQFEGTWTSYESEKIKICNWGDYRIPNSGNLDIGAGEFSSDKKYNNMGWENYRLAYKGYDVDELNQKALIKENEEWWKK